MAQSRLQIPVSVPVVLEPQTPVRSCECEACSHTAYYPSAWSGQIMICVYCKSRVRMPEDR